MDKVSANAQLLHLTSLEAAVVAPPGALGVGKLAGCEGVDGTGAAAAAAGVADAAAAACVPLDAAFAALGCQ